MESMSTESVSPPMATRPKSVLVPVVFEREDEPPQPTRGLFGSN